MTVKLLTDEHVHKIAHWAWANDFATMPLALASAMRELNNTARYIECGAAPIPLDPYLFPANCAVSDAEAYALLTELCLQSKLAIDNNHQHAVQIQFLTMFAQWAAEKTL